MDRFRVRTPPIIQQTIWDPKQAKLIKSIKIAFEKPG
jgi:hypothetical protein